VSTEPVTPVDADTTQEGGAGPDPSNTPIEQLVTDLDPDDDALLALSFIQLQEIRRQQASLGSPDAAA
jgi:hypothetical protein